MKNNHKETLKILMNEIKKCTTNEERDQLFNDYLDRISETPLEKPIKKIKK